MHYFWCIVQLYWAKEKRGDVIDNNPIAVSAEKAYNAMNREGVLENGTPNSLSVNDMVAVVEAMSDPRYIVHQGANDRYVEVVEFDTENGKKAFAVIEIGNDKNACHMNGFEGGLYNILVTTYPPFSGKLKELLNNSQNEVIYDKQKDVSQRSSSGTAPSLLNDTPFFEDSVAEKDGTVKRVERCTIFGVSFNAIGAACDGDYSGIVAIGKFVGFCVFLFVMAWLITHPDLLVIVIAVLIIIVVGYSSLK